MNSHEKGDQRSDISPRIGDLFVYFVSLVVGPKTITHHKYVEKLYILIIQGC